MSFKKTHDLAVKVGSYTDSQGNDKARYLNVGLVLTDEKGSTMMLLNRTFNPAGCPNPDGKDTVIISKFEVKDKDKKQNQSAPTTDEE